MPRSTSTKRISTRHPRAGRRYRAGNGERSPGRRGGEPDRVVGMRMNPFPKKARRLLDAAGLAYKYLEYGSYIGNIAGASRSSCGPAGPPSRCV